jgi:hypothetical protein
MPVFAKTIFLHPRCVTHQLMAIRLLQKRNCGDHRKLTMRLLDIIETELSWDFRVTDSYLQRTLMLAESGDMDRLKPVWIQRILDAQMPDGGWSDFHPLLDIGSMQLGMTSTWPATGARASTWAAPAASPHSR